MRWLCDVKNMGFTTEKLFLSFLCLWCFDPFFWSLFWWRRKKLRVVAGGWWMISSSKLERVTKVNLWIANLRFCSQSSQVLCEKQLFAKFLLEDFEDFVETMIWTYAKKKLRTQNFEIHGCQPYEWLDDVFFGPPIIAAKMVYDGCRAPVPRGTFSPRGVQKSGVMLPNSFMTRKCWCKKKTITASKAVLLAKQFFFWVQQIGNGEICI